MFYILLSSTKHMDLRSVHFAIVHAVDFFIYFCMY